MRFELDLEEIDLIVSALKLSKHLNTDEPKTKIDTALLLKRFLDEVREENKIKGE